MDNTIATTNVINGIRDWVAIGGGVVGFIGGAIGIYSALRPPKISASHTDHIGVVVSTSGTTPSLHLPLVISNHAKNPGVVTLLQLFVRPVEGEEVVEFEWGLFWKEEAIGRTPEKSRSPIPVPGYTCVERNIQFNSKNNIRFEPVIYEFELHVRVGRRRKVKTVSRFYARPSEAQCKWWYTGPYAAGPLFDELNTYKDKNDLEIRA
jgi:hypothetical protein